MIWLHVLIQLVRHHHLQRVLQSHGAEPQEDYGQRWRGGVLPASDGPLWAGVDWRVSEIHRLWPGMEWRVVANEEDKGKGSHAQVWWHRSDVWQPSGPAPQCQWSTPDAWSSQHAWSLLWNWLIFCCCFCCGVRSCPWYLDKRLQEQDKRLAWSWGCGYDSFCRQWDCCCSVFCPHDASARGLGSSPATSSSSAHWGWQTATDASCQSGCVGPPSDWPANLCHLHARDGDQHPPRGRRPEWGDLVRPCLSQSLPLRVEDRRNERSHGLPISLSADDAWIGGLVCKVLVFLFDKMVSWVKRNLVSDHDILF